jgi:hypothetical protein
MGAIPELITVVAGYRNEDENQAEGKINKL